MSCNGGEALIIKGQGLKALRAGQLVINDLDLTVAKGEKIAIVGPNGAGKTSLFDLICGELALSEGSLFVREKSVGELYSESRQLRLHKAKIARINQNLGLVEHLSALENVMMGRLCYMSPVYSPLRFYPRGERLLALECLDRVGLADFSKNIVKQMSGGQRQKVAIARALAQKAEIILADEPTAALDPAASYAIAELLVDIASSQQITLISILHDMALLPVLSDRVIGIRSGRVIFDHGSETLSHQTLRGFYDEQAVIGYSH